MSDSDETEGYELAPNILKRPLKHWMQILNKELQGEHVAIKKIKATGAKWPKKLTDFDHWYQKKKNRKYKQYIGKVHLAWHYLDQISFQEQRQTLFVITASGYLPLYEFSEL